METPKQTLALDVSSRGASRQVVYLGEGDVNGTSLVVSVTEDGRPFDCDGYTPYLMVPIGTEAMYRQGGTASGNTVTIPINESDLGNVDGRMPNAYVSLEGGDGTMTSTQRFDVIVTRSMRDAPRPDQFTTDVATLLARIEELEQAVAGINQTSGTSGDGNEVNPDGD